MKELENGKKKLLITGMILIIIAVCAAGIFAYGSHKNNQKAAAKLQERKAATGKDYLSFYYMEASSYEIAE